MLYKSIFDIELSEDEKSIMLDGGRFCRYFLEKSRDEKELRKNLSSLVSKDIYFMNTNDDDRFMDLFFVFMNRRHFDIAYQYEELLRENFVSIFETRKSDIYNDNELEYYEWRKKNP